MPDETAPRSAGTSDRRGPLGGGSSEQSPLQARAQFLKNRGWELVVGVNRGACARGGAQHGQNSESYRTVETEWRNRQPQILTLQETLDFLRYCHRCAPFLFFNGNTFADVGRTVADLIFADLATSRRREATSAIAHYIAGVLDREVMVEVVEGLCESADFQPGDRVKTFRGTLHGAVVRLLPDGRVAWQPDGGTAEFLALPESLLRVQPPEST